MYTAGVIHIIIHIIIYIYIYALIGVITAYVDRQAAQFCLGYNYSSDACDDF